MDELNKKVSYMFYGGAALAVLLVFSSVYFFTQISALDNKITQTLFDQNLQLQARLTQLETKVSALEQLNPLKFASMKLYYDSACASCKNDALLAGMDNFTRAMAASNVQVTVIDASNGAQLPSGLGKLPAFYASSADVANNRDLVDVFNNLVQNGGYQLEQLQGGVAVVAPAHTELLNSSCRGAKPRVDAFYSGDSLVGSQGVSNAKEYALANGVDYRMRCVGSDNSTRQKCIEDIGAANYTESQQLYAQYEVNGGDNARFVVDCKYEFTALSAEEFAAGLCLARPDACAQANPTASAKAA